MSNAKVVEALQRERLIEELDSNEELIYALAEQSLANFVRAAWQVLEPNTPLLWGWHLDAICEHLEAVNRGKIKRLIINIPPRNLKSIITSVCWPVWTWAQRAEKGNPLIGPPTRMIFTSYSQILSTKNSIDRRTLIESTWFQQGWGDRFELAADTNRQTEFANDYRGHMFATSMGGTATGRGGNILVVDDPHDTTSAASETQRNQDLLDFDQKFTSRLDDKKNGAIVIVMQRLHVSDLTGHVLGKPGGKEQWTQLSLPAIAEDEQRVEFPISGRVVVREPGSILHPEREGHEELERTKQDLGSMGFSGQYQQRPVSAEGGVFQRKWFKLQRLSSFPPMDVELQSWDFAVKDKKTSDFVVGLVLGRKGTTRYVIDMVRGRMNFPDSCSALVALSAKHPRAYKKAVEDKANGPAIIETVKSKVTGVVPVVPKGDKMQRANAISPEVEAGNWVLPEDAPWVSDFLLEVCNFPKDKHDDIVDAFTQGGLLLKASGPAMAPQAGHGSQHARR